MNQEICPCLVDNGLAKVEQLVFLLVVNWSTRYRGRDYIVYPEP
jgi:hypothetical protein